MSMQIFEESGVFDPSFWGLKVGDILQVIAVGGGGGGGCSVQRDASGLNFKVRGGNAGECGYAYATSIEGTYVSSSYCGGGGGGYGGGGGGSGGNNRSGAGGGGGYLKTTTIKLTSLDPIAVTVGKGGKGGYDNNHLDGEDGEASSFGSYISANGGGGGKCYALVESIGEIKTGGHGGTNGGDCTPEVGGGGGGGYLIGCNVRGNGGHAVNVSDLTNTKYAAIENAIGLGGTGGSNAYPRIMIKPGSLGGGTFSQIAGPGSGVVVVTW